nr:oleosin-B6-like [Aegilops tauschii subsp. strangulata]
MARRHMAAAVGADRRPARPTAGPRAARSPAARALPRPPAAPSSSRWPPPPSAAPEPASSGASPPVRRPRLPELQPAISLLPNSGEVRPQAPAAPRLPLALSGRRRLPPSPAAAPAPAILGDRAPEPRQIQIGAS